ncbi:MAG TPA: hypothetical protein VGQ46_18730 [Thermoanaerobaculia bacterium]|jgi:uncharacterized repeat protein (TIGR01451 family)|nr:hypothetical protein [Thermoanaerobaculia bacterium]
MSRRHSVALVLCLLLALPILAAKRVTDVNGHEVSVGSSAAPARTAATSGVRAAGLRPRAASIVTINSGPDTDAANNDYRRIQNALNAAANGDTIILSGTFDFTAPFAAAAWAAGNDGIAGNADDYEVSAPRGVNNVTLTASSLGSATIQGPGDLPALDLEGFLVFDASLAPGGGAQGWTISNLRILDFDLSIGMFAVGVSDYNNTTITNNFIRIATDLNATVAPSDTIQNIGIHFSFGTNETISNNTFNVPGDGVSNGANLSSTVVMQSNTSGGAVYNGLNIFGNVTHVLNAQSANPQVILGIWDNCHAHSSNINITNNSFLNDAVGNSPALNIERAFRVTSHSSATTTVNYTGNTMSGANIGFQWISASNFTGNLPVNLIGNVVTSCDTGVFIQSNGVAHLDTDVISGSGAGGGVHVVTGLLSASGANTNGIFRTFVTGGSADGVHIDATAGAITAPMTQNDFSNNTGFGLNNQSATGISATLNYWGSNIAANVAAEVNGNVTFDPWLASGTDISGIVGFQPFIWATTTTVANKTTLIGTGAADTGSMLATSPITLTMDGDTGFVPTAQLLNVDIQLGGSDDVFTLGQTGIPTILDGGAGNDTLIGTNVAQTWNITAANSGNIPGATSAFQGVESLTGGSAADNFVFSAAGSIAQKLDGGLGTDTLDNTAIPAHIVAPTGPGTLDGFKGTATGVGTTFDNINIVAAPADIAVNKTGPATAGAATTINYTITVTNNGPNPAINAMLSDAIPAGTFFLSFSAPAGWNCNTPPPFASSGTISCTTASMAAGSAVFTLSLAGPQVPTVLNNTAVVSSSSADPNPGNNSSTATTNVIISADLVITKSATATAPQGTNVTYTITLTNNGPNFAINATMTDVLPPNTTFVSLSPDPFFTCTTPGVGSNGTINCTSLTPFLSGTPATFTIVVNVSPNAPLGTLNNTATATTTSTDPTTPNTSTAGTTITAGNADVGVVKTAAPGLYGTGNSLTYTIAVNNAGPTAAANVTVTDAIPAGATFVSAIPTQGSCSGTTTVTCSLGSIANLGSASIALTITLPSVPGTVVNTATVSTTSPDPNAANNSSTSTITVIPAANIPAISPMLLLLLAIALAMAGFIVQRLD